MNHLEAVLRAAALDLAGLRLRWAVVGGLAVSARTEPRFTRDVDLVIAVADDRGAEQAIHSLQRRGYTSTPWWSRRHESAVAGLDRYLTV